MIENNLASKLNVCRGITAVIGSGGKTTLIKRLAAELKERGTVIVCTSTKIIAPDYCECLICEHQEEYTSKELAAMKEWLVSELKKARIASIGTKFVSNEGLEKVDAPALSFAELSGLCDYLLIEADGSKGLPMKAHASFEPVIPNETIRTIQIVGASGFNNPIALKAHRPNIYADICGCSVDDIITGERAARVINYEKLCDIVYVTQKDENNSFAVEEFIRKSNFQCILSDY